MYIPSCSGKCYLGAKEDPPIFAEKELDRAIVQINGGDGKRERISALKQKGFQQEVRTEVWWGSGGGGNKLYSTFLYSG